MRYLRFAAAMAPTLCVLTLAACGTNPDGSPKGLAIPNILSPGSPAISLTGNPLKDFAPITSKIAAMTIADVDDALADALKQNPVDGVGVACWSAVKSASPILALPKGAGIATVIQHGRDAQTVGPELIKQCSSIIPFLGVGIPIIP